MKYIILAKPWDSFYYIKTLFSPLATSEEEAIRKAENYYGDLYAVYKAEVVK